MKILFGADATLQRAAPIGDKRSKVRAEEPTSDSFEVSDWCESEVQPSGQDEIKPSASSPAGSSPLSGKAHQPRIRARVKGRRIALMLLATQR